MEIVHEITARDSWVVSPVACDLVTFLEEEEQVVVEDVEVLTLAIDVVQTLKDGRDMLQGPYEHPSEESRVTLTCAMSMRSPDFEFFYNFRQEDLAILVNCLQIPTTFTTAQGDKSNCVEGLLLFLRRLHTGETFTQLASVFGREKGILARIFDYILVRVNERTTPGLMRVEQDFLSLEQCRIWAQEVSSVTQIQMKVLGFVDGTVVEVARPLVNQRIWYSGKHGRHCMKFISWIFPCGIGFVGQPFCGSTHDSRALRLDNLDNKFQQSLTFGNEAFQMFGDKGFALSGALITPYKPARDPEEQLFNSQMNVGRTSVEWFFRIIKRDWSLLKNPARMKTGCSKVALFFYASLHLSNLKTILRGGNEISDFFGSRTLSLDQYMTCFDENN